MALQVISNAEPAALMRCLPFSTHDGSRPQILATVCSECNYTNFPPSHVCAHCMSLAVSSLALSQAGVLYSYTTMRSGTQSVFVGYVDLPEKIRVFAEIDGFQAGHPPACGSKVTLITIRYGAGDERKAGPVFVFTSATAAGATA